MNTKDSIIKAEMEKIIKTIRSNQGLGCDYRLSSEAICYVNDIEKIIEEKHNACVMIFEDILNISWYYD